MFPAHRHSFRAARLLLGALIFLQAFSWALSSIGETCYSRQHRDTTVNVREGQDLQRAVMDVRKKAAERDCILACCSEELKPGIMCNMVVYKPSGQDGNCYLFYCETEQHCPLMPAKPGTNTYDIFKGMTHPSTKLKERVHTMPVTKAKQLAATQSLATSVKPSTATATTQPTTSTAPSSTTTSPTSVTTSTVAPAELAIILLTMPAEVVPTTATTTTTTTPSSTTTRRVPSTTRTTTTTDLVAPPQPPPVRSSKKQVKPPKKPETHGKPGPKVSEIPTLPKQATPKTMVVKTSTTTTTTATTPTTTTTSTTTTHSTTTTTTHSTTTTTNPSTTTTTNPSTTTTTTTTTSTPPTTTTTTLTPTTERTTIVVVEMDSELKDGDSGPAGASASEKPKESPLLWKNSLALLVVLTLVILLFVVAVVGRRAMESFDRRHYTRLELNDLHYEI